jgi:5-methylcytosine-specific restriction endonuclease McrA
MEAALMAVRSEEARAKQAEYQRAWRLANPEIWAAQKARHYHAHPELHAERLRAWRAAHPEHHAKDAERERIRRLTTPGYYRTDEYRANRAASSHRRRAAKAEAPGDFTVEEFAALCEAHEYRCVYCGCDGKMTADHAIPLSRGGSNYISNIVPACKSCNSSKGTRTVEEFLSWRVAA